ncbi:hypothetical protein ACJIZ3_008122 [Penstemon smallii]|uniref:Zinc-finger domain-containing protein n=1 Tax=Penstemon smallii TaxID=265156 RepID=A0ABD3T9V4_9LAMI
MEISGYEQLREERIKGNAERMQKLGIFDLSRKLKSSIKRTPNRPSNRKTPRSQSLIPTSGPVRRSSRLQNSTPVSYSEVDLTKKDKSLDDNNLLREEWSKPEVYSEEHEKLLGSTEMSWTLFVDGYGKDGKRIYDPVRGKTCHQCRQKTLGHRTHCSQCNMVQGQFCGDCLYMRYGENVLEANANPNWTCPVCRGICNCSLCRQAKGWPATGSLYRKISSLGYKSVAHYLIQTRRANTDSDKSIGTKVPVSAKRSLPFLDTEVTPAENELSKSNKENLKIDLQSEFDATNDGLNDKIVEEILPNEDLGDSKTAPESEADALLEPAISTLSKDEVECALEPEPEKCASESDKRKDVNFELETTTESEITTMPLNDPSIESGEVNEIKKEDTIILDNKIIVAPETSPKSTKKRVVYVPTPDSIAGRLRQRRNKRSINEVDITAIEARPAQRIRGT